MAKRGPKPKPPALKVIAGTDQPCRQTEQAVPAIEPEDPEFKPPSWLKGRGKRIWQDKIAKYQKRGQQIAGCEDALAQYCALEASLIDDYWRKKLTPPVAMINAFRVFAGEFYDTPASQVKPATGNKDKNPFGRNGKRPDA